MAIKTFDTENKPCPYLDGQTQRVFIHSFVPDGKISQEKYWELRRKFKLARIKAGYFNQSSGVGEFKCPTCRKCFSAAVKMDDFAPSKSQKRLLRRSNDITFSISVPFATREMYDLFQDYLHKRHPNSSMIDFSFEGFRGMVMGHSYVALLKLDNKVIGMSLIDADKEIIVGDYCFYDMPISKDRNLGTLMDLKILEHAESKGIPFVSFGALNDDSPKLKHKGQYAGTHIFTGKRWETYNKPKV